MRGRGAHSNPQRKTTTNQIQSFYGLVPGIRSLTASELIDDSYGYDNDDDGDDSDDDDNDDTLMN